MRELLLLTLSAGQPKRKQETDYLMIKSDI